MKKEMKKESELLVIHVVNVPSNVELIVPIQNIVYVFRKMNFMKNIIWKVDSLSSLIMKFIRFIL